MAGDVWGAAGQAYTTAVANNISRTLFFSQDERQVIERLIWSPAQSLLFRSSDPSDPFAEFGRNDYDQLHAPTIDLENQLENHEQSGDRE